MSNGGQLLPPFPISPGSSSKEQWKGTLRRADLWLQKMRPWNLTTVTTQGERKSLLFPSWAILKGELQFFKLGANKHENLRRETVPHVWIHREEQGFQQDLYKKKHRDAASDTSQDGCSILAF